MRKIHVDPNCETCEGKGLIVVRVHGSQTGYETIDCPICEARSEALEDSLDVTKEGFGG